MRTALCLIGAGTLLTGFVCAAPFALAAGPSATRGTIVTSAATTMRPVVPAAVSAVAAPRALLTTRPTLTRPVSAMPVKPSASPVAQKLVVCTSSVLARKGVYVAAVPAGVNNAPCVLNAGVKNVAVTALQNTLSKCYDATLDVNGNFGPGTKKALITAQKALGLKADGSYGPATRARLDFLWLDTSTPGRAACGRL